MEKKNKKNSTALKAVVILLICLVLVSAVALAVNLFQRQAAQSTQPTAVSVPESMLNEQDESSSASVPSAANSTSDSENNAAEDESDSSGAVSTRTSTGGGAVTNTSNGSSSAQATTEVQASSLLLYQGMPQANEKFQVQNMVPGDVVTKYFCVRAYHNTDITLAFQTEVTDQTRDLGKVLNIKVTRLNDGAVLCDAPFNEVDKKEFSQRVETASDGKNDLYRIDVSLDTSVGNEYQAAQLKADFNWYVTDQVKALAPLPQTGDTTELLLWSVLAAGSSLLLACIYFWRKKEASRNEYAK